MIYCVVPEELAPELFDRLNDYYADDANVQVIIDRRKSERRRREEEEAAAAAAKDEDHHREVRDRRRSRVPGDFPQIDTDAAG